MKRYERDATHTFHSDLLVELDCVLVRWILQVTVIHVQPLVESEHEVSLVLAFTCTFSWAGEELTQLNSSFSHRVYSWFSFISTLVHSRL